MMTHGLCERHQWAFRCFRSTETALVKAQNDLLRAIDDDCGVFLALLDLFSAFDTLDHEILPQRLEESVGMSGIAPQWMKSYLCGRLQCVVVDGVKSDFATLQHGVPQFSVLGPIVFTVYIMPQWRDCPTPHVEIHLFADDSHAALYMCTFESDRHPTNSVSTTARLNSSPSVPHGIVKQWRPAVSPWDLLR